MIGSVGWIAGDHGVILHSEDDGITWEIQSTPTRENLKSEFFQNADCGWVAGDNGTLLQTDDGGSAWTLCRTNSMADFSSIDFADSLNGWAVGFNGSIHTSDGGRHWTASSLRGQTIDFASPDLGIIVSEQGMVMRSLNKGLKWDTVSFVAYLPRIDGVTFLNARIGFATGLLWPYQDSIGTLWFTADSGSSWLVRNTGGFFENITFDSLAGLVRVGGNQISVSVDTSKSWASTQTSNHWEQFKASCTSASGNAIVVGNSGAIFRFNFNTLAYSEISTGQRATLYDVATVSANHCWALGIDGFLESVDGGATWNLREPIPEHAKEIRFLDSVFGWITASQGKLYVTSDGGATWIDRSSPNTGYVVDGYFLDSGIGWSLANHFLWRTSDTGKNWSLVGKLSDGPYGKIFFTDTLHGWALSSEDPILRTENGGISWTAPDQSSPNWLWNLVFADSLNGWAVGGANYSYLFHTIDGGSSWQQMSVNGVQEIFDISVTSAREAYVVSDGGGIHFTADGGTSWTRQSVPTHQLLTAISIRDSNIGWAVGLGGVILKVEDGK